MGANRSGDNLRRKRKRHEKNVRTYEAALEKQSHAKKPARAKKAATSAAKAK
jgi:hypothetical protein